MNYFKLEEALSPFNSYCSGIIDSGYPGSSYLSAIVIGTDKIKVKNSKNLSEIIAYDKAEVASAFIGQINMIPVSSFCGIKGAIWGYDLMRSKDFYQSVEGYKEEISGIPIYSASPMRNAAKKLFGTVDNKNFPLMPGSLVPCAYKTIRKKGPITLFCGSVVAIPEDRYSNACLYMEEVGEWDSNSQQTLLEYKNLMFENLIYSAIEVGKNQHVKYKEVFIDVEKVDVMEDEYGCALVSHPYFTLAKNAVNDYILNNYNNISLEEWESLML